ELPRPGLALEVHDPVRPRPPLHAALATGALDQDLDRAALVLPIALEGGRLLERDEPLEPLLNHVLRDLVLEARGRRAGAGRVLERVRAVESRLSDDPEGVGEVLLGLAGESDDDVGGDG